MPKPYPEEFRADVVKVARRRPEGTTIEQIAHDFGVHPMTLSKWLRQARVGDGTQSAVLRVAFPLLAQSAIDRLHSNANELVVAGESYRRRQRPGIDTTNQPEPSSSRRL